MLSKGAVVTKILVVAVAVAIAAGCSAEVRRLQGANQKLVADRDAMQKQIDDLKAMLDQQSQQQAAFEAKLQKAQADVDYWKGQAEAYGDAYGKRTAMGDMGFPEKLMRDIADKIGAVYLPGGGIRLASDVLFDSGKSDLKAEAANSLRQVSQALQTPEAQGLFLRVDGHTDSQPIKYSKWKDNMELSQARSRSVWLELKNTGVSPDRMFTAGFGEYKPIDTNASAVGRANNRRVEIWLVPAPGTAGGAEAAAETKTAQPLPEPTK